MVHSPGLAPQAQQLLKATANPKSRQRWLWGTGGFLIAGALMAFIVSVVYSHDSRIAARLSAPALAVVLNVNGPNFGYRYGACTGGGTLRPPPAVGAQLHIFYDPTDPCDNINYDPVARQRSDLAWLLVVSALISLGVGSAGWDVARQRAPAT